MPRPKRFPWPNQARRLLQCPGPRGFDPLVYAAAVDPGINEALALLERRRPGGHYASKRPMRNPAEFRIFERTLHLSIVPTLAQIVREMAAIAPDERMITRAINAWDHLVEFFIMLDQAA